MYGLCLLTLGLCTLLLSRTVCFLMCLVICISEVRDESVNKLWTVRWHSATVCTSSWCWGEETWFIVVWERRCAHWSAA